MRLGTPIDPDNWPLTAESYYDFIEEVCQNIPEEFDDDVAVEAIIIKYVRYLEKRRLEVSFECGECEGNQYSGHAESCSHAIYVSAKAKAILEEINELLCDGFAGKAAVKFGDFLDMVESSPR